MQSARFKQPFQAQLLAFVLVIVLTWYTVVGTPLEVSSQRSSGGDENRAQERSEYGALKGPLEDGQADIDFLASTDLIAESGDDDEWPDIIFDER